MLLSDKYVEYVINISRIIEEPVNRISINLVYGYVFVP